MSTDERERGTLQLSIFSSPGFSTPDDDGDLLNGILFPSSDNVISSDDVPSCSRPWCGRETEAWEPPDSSLVSEWAERHRVLSTKFSAFPGPWIHKAHYAVEIMDAFLDPIVEDLTIMAAAQSCKTDLVYNMLGYAIDQDPAPAIISMPTLLTLGRVNERIKDMIEESPELSKHLTGTDDDLSLKKIKLDKMNIYFVTAGSSADLRNVIARYIIMDEIDDYPESTGRGAQGSPIGQIEARGTTFWNRKKIKLCTPTVEDGNINLEFQKSDRRSYYVPCPYCLGYQVLNFSRIKHKGCALGDWPKHLRNQDYILSNSVARYDCEHCHAEIEEKYKPWMDSLGTWIPEGHPIYKDESSGAWCIAIPMPRTRHRGWQWGAEISPFRTWSEMAAKFFEVKDNPEDLKVFVNLWRGEVWREATIKRETEEILVLKTDRPALIVPAGTVALTAGVDNQKFGKWIVIRAWVCDGRAVEGHLIRHGFVETFEELETWIFEDVYPVENSDVVLPIWRGAIDIGGGEKGEFEDETMTEEVYEWLRARGRGIMFGCRGLSRQIGGGKKMRSSIIDRFPSRCGKTGRPIPGGLKLWLLDTALIKNSIWSRIESGKFHLHADVDETYAKHMIAEQKEKNQQGKSIWTVKGHRANHLFDAEVYCSAMADPECDGGVMVLRAPGASLQQPGHERRIIRSNWMGGS